jgi:hypothetical protein
MRIADPPITREEAERNCRSNLGYYAGYYDAETMARVQRLFKCVHPVFGKVESEEDLPSPEEAFAMGQKAGEEAKAKINEGGAKDGVENSTTG